MAFSCSINLSQSAGHGKQNDAQNKMANETGCENLQDLSQIEEI
jgi:hypothetical protein